MNNMQTSPTLETVSICGVLIHVLPEKMPEVKPRMLAIEGLEIHGMSDEGRVVVTVESDSYKLTSDRITKLQKLKGVLSASMIYQHTEEVSD